ncbi:MAG TPA: hypothetical protein VH475_00100, partial [Tepidisphaeraceae bacterium]
MSVPTWKPGDAERWLRENDQEYKGQAKAWRDIRAGRLDLRDYRYQPYEKNVDRDLWDGLGLPALAKRPYVNDCGDHRRYLGPERRHEGAYFGPWRRLAGKILPGGPSMPLSHWPDPGDQGGWHYEVPGGYHPTGRPNGRPRSADDPATVSQIRAKIEGLAKRPLPEVSYDELALCLLAVYERNTDQTMRVGYKTLAKAI